MKRKIYLYLSLFLLTFVMVACENATQITSAYITEITAAGSDNYGVRITFASDSRIEEKGVDVQIKFNKTGEITLWQENQERITYTIEESDEWYSMATIFAEENKERFETYKDAVNRTYLFNSDQPIEVTFRAVVGTIENNLTGEGQVLAESQPVSKQFILKIK